MFDHHPPIAEVPADAGFTQTIRERGAARGSPEIGRLVWHATPDEGTAQLLELHVAESDRRQGCGTRLVREMLEQIARLNAGRASQSLGRPVRVVWTVVGQKRHLPVRSFLTHLGFHHVATSKHLYLDDDAMMYAKALD